ncbi:VOC family protein [Actinacidiphila yeochonensis]|uniref:VOC family protein n=1 Tax=Actinacidiphila yeochonensis TaxID=89050 RepID=UPI00055E631B|nr:VOC family protein [Actinacidiphila yeochonensis]
MLSDDYVPGAPDWLDLGSRDVAAAAAFYKALFGWEFQSAGPQAGGYGMFQLDGRTVAAAGPLQGDGAAPVWTVYFETADADATTKAVEQAGGSVRAAPADVFDRGRRATYADPAGAEFAVWQPAATKGLDRVGAGALCWTELYTPDSAQAVRFYSSVFSWDSEGMPLPGGAGVYTVVSRAGGGQELSHGGIMQLSPDMLPDGSYWQPYFGVADADVTVEAATAHHGTVVMPATDMEGVGRIALLKDPEGAPFAVLEPAPTMS